LGVAGHVGEQNTLREAREVRASLG